MKKSLNNRKQLRQLKQQARRERLELRAQSGTLVAERVVGFSLLGLLIALMVLVAATIYTPLLAIKQITIEGNQRIESERLSQSLGSLMEQPLTTVSEEQIAELLAEFPLLESFAFQAKPPNTLGVIIRERQPVATVAVNGKLVLFDAAGIELAEATESDEYPQVLVAENPAESIRYKSAVGVLLSMPVELFRQVERVQLRTQDSVVLILRNSSSEVIWGDDSDARLKYEVLIALMNNQDQTVDYDVSAPLAPVVTFRDF